MPHSTVDNTAVSKDRAAKFALLERAFGAFATKSTNYMSKCRQMDPIHLPKANNMICVTKKTIPKKPWGVGIHPTPLL
jgi:hypothetical protein